MSRFNNTRLYPIKGIEHTQGKIAEVALAEEVLELPALVDAL